MIAGAGAGRGRHAAVAALEVELGSRDRSVDGTKWERKLAESPGDLWCLYTVRGRVRVLISHISS